MIPSTQIPKLDKEGKSVFFLGLVQTPSTRYFDIVLYDKAYTKTQPWRTVFNSSAKVTHYQELPEMPDE